MLEVAKEYIVRLDRSGEFAPIADRLDYNSVIDFLDANMVGVRVTLELTELTPKCYDNNG